MSAPLLLLAGTSEAGKSTAGQYLAALGAHRVKIRSILLRLTTGHEVHHEGIPTREGFSTDEFLYRILALDTTGHPVLVIESFIDVNLAIAVKHTWPARADILFITAPRQLRVTRLATSAAISTQQAQQIIAGKDARKQVARQLPAWRAATDHWIDNTADLSALTTRLRELFHAIQTPPEGR